MQATLVFRSARQTAVATFPSPLRKISDNSAAAAAVGAVHYRLPARLRDLLLQRLGSAYWQQAMEKEAALDASCGRLTVGLWHGRPLKFPLLCAPPPRITQAQARRLGTRVSPRRSACTKPCR